MIAVEDSVSEGEKVGKQVRRRVREYALYHGDTFLNIGTPEQLAKIYGVERHTIIWWATPTYLKRLGPNSNRFVSVPLPDDED